MKRLIFTLFFALCITSCGTPALLSKSYMLSEGMSKEDVIQMLGTPCSSEIRKGVEEWHYCQTGLEADTFLAVYFYAGKVIATKPYTVTIADTKGAGGACKNFIKRGTYQEPDVVVEFRNR